MCVWGGDYGLVLMWRGVGGSSVRNRQHGVHRRCCWILGVKMNLIPPRHENVLDWLNMMG